MREMKDSGIEWIGNIPYNWEINKIKYVSSKVERGTAPNYTDDNKTKVVNQATFSKGFFDKKNIRFSKIPASLSRGLLKKNDTLLASTGGGVLGKTYFFTEDEEYVADSHVTITRAIDEIIQSKYIYYFYSINYDVFNAIMAVGSTNQTELQRDLLLNMFLPVPPISEQVNIISFLDSQCAKIDALTADIQAEIDILEQYKKSVITEAVTKGLDPNVEMKDSGIEWCPLIPSHWEYSNPKALFKQRTDRAFPNEKQLTSSQEYGIIYQDEYMELTGNRIVTVIKDFSILKHVEPNDFVISMRSFQGGLEYSEKRGSISSAYIMLIPNDKYVYAPFYRWFFKSSKYINAIQSTSNLVRDGQAMRYANFAQVPLFIIPLDEQKSIAEYLDNKIGEIDYILSEKKRQVGTLFNYKKSLIYEYVTGKKDVPIAPNNTIVAVEPQAILLGGIVKRIGNSQHGRTQLQKLLYLCNTHLGLNLNIQYYRYEHGPYDVHLNDYIRELVKNQWFNEKTQDKKCVLVSGKRWADFEQNYPDPFGEKKQEIGELFKQLKNLSTKQIERIATLYAAWNDFLLDGTTPSDDQIIQDVVTNWTENKAHFQYTTWQESLNQLKQYGLIPKGTGLHTLPKP